MNDNPLFSLIRTVVVQGIGYYLPSVDVVVRRDFQPVQQGATLGAAVYIHPIADNRYGYPLKQALWVDDEFIQTESVNNETTFQVNARVIQQPDDVNQITANDVVNIVAATLQSDIAIAAFKAQGVGIYRVTSIRQTPVRNEMDRNEYSPSFDFTLCHTRTIALATPKVDVIEPGIYRV